MTYKTINQQARELAYSINNNNIFVLTTGKCPTRPNGLDQGMLEKAIRTELQRVERRALREIDDKLCSIIHDIRGTKQEDRRDLVNNPIINGLPDATTA